MSKIKVTVEGAVGAGKTALCGALADMCISLGLSCEWKDGQQERNLNFQDWGAQLVGSRPTVEIVEVLSRKIQAEQVIAISRKYGIPAEAARALAECYYNLDPAPSQMLPLEPTEDMIRAGCLAQSKKEYATYEEWVDDHTSGVAERIRALLVHDYKAMVAAYKP